MSFARTPAVVLSQLILFTRSILRIFFPFGFYFWSGVGKWRYVTDWRDLRTNFEDRFLGGE